MMAMSMAALAGLRPTAGIAVRHFSCGIIYCAGKNWRVSHGFAPSDSEYGPLTDLPDWSFADGRPGIPWKGQVRRKEQREQFARRVVMLNKEMAHGIRVWEEAQHQTIAQQEETRRHRLKEKGAILRRKDKE
ncbi:large ribosomal subunit protein mL52 [Microcaecilia unicolor]|uniref:Large ribosomal subunit protein mL52 n=1 Tax=Microcaecilia unicolor TaxID=1415580 RepID=A0A6P7WJS7_9AMPH|nr:39S ribosomal protein L52, mitochondrial [Microcaecilia unicolor]